MRHVELLFVDRNGGILCEIILEGYTTYNNNSDIFGGGRFSISKPATGRIRSLGEIRKVIAILYDPLSGRCSADLTHSFNSGNFSIGTKKFTSLGTVRMRDLEFAWPNAKKL